MKSKKIQMTRNEEKEIEPSYELLYTFNRFPAPQYSLLFPAHSIEQLESATLLDALDKPLSQ